MLNREALKELIEEEFKERGIKIPKDISRENLVESFCKYMEDDHHEWIKDNFKTFFNHGKPDWNWIRERIKHYSKRD